MKKVVAFLLALIIFVAPITTLAKADVVIGDNDETIINENATVLGRKLALMESLSDLALSGVTEFTISNTNDVDTYLDYLWQELDSAINSLADGTGFTEISNTLKSKYYTNLVQYKDYITNRGSYLAQLLPTGSPTTTLLSTFFADNIFGKHYTQHYDLALDMFKSLSQFNSDSGSSGNLPSQYDWFNVVGTYGIGNERINISTTSINKQPPSWGIDLVNNVRDFSNYSFYSPDGRFNNSLASGFSFYTLDIFDIYLYESQGYWVVDYSDMGSRYTANSYFYIPSYDMYINYNAQWKYESNYIYGWSTWQQQNYIGTTQPITGFDTALNWVFNHFRHVNVYVNDELWVQADGNVPISPSLDIDGFLKIYGDNQPAQYQLQPNTKIDYDELYTTIYNAIRDNLPISQGDINYYDSHDTIYSPMIINNYGEEEGDESDLIDTILDYAVIPKFDTAIAQPMRTALTYGVLIMQIPITNVIPDEILLVLGACFFLLLFAVVINRMIK